MAAAKILPGLVPGAKDISTIKQYNPLNATDRVNTINGKDLGNGVGSFPVNMNQGLIQETSQLLLLADAFLPSIGMTGNMEYRQVFDKDTLPQNKGTLAKQYLRVVGMDTNPMNASLTGLTGWDPQWNEVTIQGTSCDATVNAYGRYFKNNSFQDAISTISWRVERAKHFATNASETLNKLAGIRLYEGANKIFVNSIAAYDPAKPLAKTLTLGADASGVTVPLTFDALLEARHAMENYKENYCLVNKATGVVDTTKTRAKSIGGYKGDSYLVLLGANGYRQVFSDARFRDSFIQNGGIAAGGMLSETIGITAPVFRMRFEIIGTPTTVSKTTAIGVDTEGMGALEVAYVFGGGASMVGVELSLEGFTKMIDVPYEDSKKVDPFSLLSLVGWMAVIDFTVIQNEAVYAIPYVGDATLILAGSVVNPIANNFKA